MVEVCQTLRLEVLEVLLASDDGGGSVLGISIYIR